MTKPTEKQEQHTHSPNDKYNCDFHTNLSVHFLWDFICEKKTTTENTSIAIIKVLIFPYYNGIINIYVNACFSLIFHLVRSLSISLTMPLSIEPVCSNLMFDTFNAMNGI